MDEVFNSVWDSLQHLTVEEMLANPQLLTEAFGERLDEFAAFDSLFETVTVPADIVPYRHAYAVYLDGVTSIFPRVARFRWLTRWCPPRFCTPISASVPSACG